MIIDLVSEISITWKYDAGEGLSLSNRLDLHPK